jgi:hypothetical protein
MMPFDDRRYTEDSIIKQLALIELHSKDGSALDAGCGCIEGKHLFIVEGLAEEGSGFALTDKEKQFYEELGNWARSKRKAIESSEWNSGNHVLQCGHCENKRGEERKECLRECKHDSHS